MPIRAHLLFQVDHAAVHEREQRDGTTRLGHRHHAGDGLRFPWPGPRGVTVATPQIDDGLAVDEDGNTRTQLIPADRVAVVHIVPERGFDGGELRIAMTRNWYVGHDLASARNPSVSVTDTSPPSSSATR